MESTKRPKLPSRLRQLKTKDGKPLITKSKELRYNVLWLLNTQNEDRVIALFNPDQDGYTPFADWREALFSLPYFDDARKKQQLAYETYLNKTIPLESISCTHCGSTNVEVSGEQKRSLDEGGTPKAVCRNCGSRFGQF